MSRPIRCLFLVLSVALPAVVAHAQGTTGAADVRVVDAGGMAVTGAAITVFHPATGLARQKRTDSNGKIWARLAPGSYVFEVSKDGYQATRIEQVSIKVGVTTPLVIPLISGPIDEIITYATPDSLMHVATGETGLNISLSEISQIPVARSIEAVALLAPGTVPGIAAFGDDKSLVSFGGASVAENVYYIDGLNVSNFRNGLGGASVPFEFYDEFQIKTGGYSPEFGRSTGGVLNATTRRGSNEFEFGVVAYYEPDALAETSPNTRRNNGTLYDLNSRDSASQSTIDVYAGGPIVPDRLFFFVLYEPQNSRSTYNEGGTPDRRVDEEIADDFWGGNLTWNISDSHEFSVTAFSDEREIIGNSYSYDVDAKQRGEWIGRSTDFRGGDSYILSYQGDLNDNLTIAAQYGNNEYDLTTTSTNDIECPLVVDQRDSAQSLFLGCALTGFANADSDERNAYRADAYFSLGQHQFRLGIDREDNTSLSAFAYSGLAFAPDRVGGAYYYYQSHNVGDVLRNGAVVPDANGDGSRVDTVRYRYFQQGGKYDTISQAWYIEDTWEINQHFTVSLGLRNEKFENRNADGETFIEIEDQWAPRIAVQWSPGDVGNQLITLNYGRYHIPVASNSNVLLAGGALDIRRYFLTDGNLDPVTGVPVAIGEDGIPTTQELGSEIVVSDGSVPDVRGVIDSSIKPMYQDEWILSYEYESVSDDWGVGIRYVHRDLKSTIEDVSMIAALEAIGADPSVIGFGQPCIYILTNPGTSANTYCDLNGDGALEETFFSAEDMRFPDAERTYEAVELTGNIELSSGLSLQGSYTWSKNLGNTEGRVKSDIGQDDAGLTEDFDLPLLMDGAYGYLPNDRRHKIKLWSVYRPNDKITLSATLLSQSGRPRNAFGQQHPDGPVLYGNTFYLAQPDGSFEFSPRGSYGRTDWTHQVNLSAIYSLEWGDRVDIELRADVFNLFDADNPTEVGEFPEVAPEEFGIAKQYQQPRYLRFGLAMRF